MRTSVALLAVVACASETGGDTNDPLSCPSPVFDFAPAPVTIDGLAAVPIDILDVDAAFELDAARATAHADVITTFALGEAEGRPILDLRQTPTSLVLVGEPIGPELLARHDFGQGLADGFSILDVELEPCTTHTLELAYPLQTPDATAASGPKFEPPRIEFDTHLSDAFGGRFLESWLPANMPWDRHPIHLDVTLTGTEVEHAMITNAAVEALAPGQWQLEWGAATSAMDPMIIIRPSDTLASISGTHAAIPYTLFVEGIEDSPASLAKDLATYLDRFVAELGDYPHDGFVALIHDTGVSMEYAGATSTDPIVFEHEVFHMWWGRGIEPATYADGWVDEAWDTYCTAVESHASIAFDWEAAPVELYDPHPFARATPSFSYSKGRLLFAGLADLMGHDALMTAMHSFYAGGELPRSFSTAQLEDHLYTSSGERPEVRRAFARFVYGLDD